MVIDQYYQKQLCIRCLGHPLIKHEKCWATYPGIPSEHEAEYWCECSCGVLEDQQPAEQ